MFATSEYLHGFFFWFLLPTEQDAFIIVSFTPKDDPQDNTENQENKTRESPRSSKQWYYDPSDKEEGEEDSDEEVGGNHSDGVVDEK